jgi:hypothetical protein
MNHVTTAQHSSRVFTTLRTNWLKLITVFGRSPVRISAMTPNNLTDVSFLVTFFRLSSKISSLNYDTRPLRSTSFKFSIDSHPVIQRCIMRDTDSVVKQAWNTNWPIYLESYM